ncbi:MAG: type II toxin-antitoxin system RelE/ParE family toxin [Bdellovibrionales bacterium]|nr:type II toxin-antitoxin system RelE/ParE family toxin [Bdellovibrionales bacterium]
MNRIFVELPPFRRYLDSISNGQVLLKEIQVVLLENPKLGDVIVGTCGLRKMRFAGLGKGKRGGFRVTYLYRPEVEKIYLLLIYAKNEKEDLSSEQKNILKSLVEQLKSEG